MVLKLKNGRMFEPLFQIFFYVVQYQIDGCELSGVIIGDKVSALLLFYLKNWL